MKYFLGTIWLLFIGYALIFSPLNPDELSLIQSLTSFDFKEIEPLVLCIFSLMGLWPFVFAPLMLSDDDYSTPAWPFWILSFGFGVFALLPYYAFRRRAHNKNRPIYKLLKFLNSKFFATIIALSTLICLGLGLGFGDFESFKPYFLNYRFVNLMTIDFFMLQCLFQFAMIEDRWNRGDSRLLPLIISFGLPILGPCIYLILRRKEDYTPY